MERERARSVVLWGDRAPGLVFEALGTAELGVAPPGAASGARPVPDPVRPGELAGLALPLPAAVTDGAAMTALFHAHPDGWAAFYRRHPGTAGLVELARPTVAAGGGQATLVVGRACGEHCRQAWQVTLARAPAGRWTVTGVVPLRVPQP